jgi:hypothetical protein
MNEQEEFRPRGARVRFKTDRLRDRSNSQAMHTGKQWYRKTVQNILQQSAA